MKVINYKYFDLYLDENKRVILPETDFDYVYVNDNGSW